jgi:predicted negative regulator of RcsB-dependent stress response
MARLVIAAMAIVVLPGLAQAQCFVGPGFQGGFVQQGGFRFGVGFGRPGFALGAFSSGYHVRAMEFWSYAPPVVFVPPPIIVAGNVAPEELPHPPGIPLRPAAKPGDFVVFRPMKAIPPDEGTITPRVDRVAPPAPPVRFDPLAPIDLGKVERPDPDPATESARQMKLARVAFAAEQYGKAAEHLTAASKARPDDTLPHFLMVQVRIAAGQYAEAMAIIRVGMKQSPAWPTASFRLRDWPKFDEHLAALRRVAEANPAEPVLAFLLGHQLWFNGDRDGARKLFREAAARVKDTTEIDRFLQIPQTSDPK